jgi:ABC-type glycerol-3-phosphate transport system permease component
VVGLVADRNDKWIRAATHGFLIVLAIVVLIPFYWMFVNSLKTQGDFYSAASSLFPTNPTLSNYKELLVDTFYGLWFGNSFIVSTLSVLLGLFICSASGFAFAAYDFKFRTVIFWAVIGSVAIPEIVTIIPVFNIMVKLGLIDTYAALVLPFAVSMFGIFLIKQFVESSFPKEILESARIDGLSEYGIFIRIVLPLIRPGIAVLAIFLWMNSWSSYFWPLIMIRSQEMMTLPLGLATLYANPWDLKYGVLMAGNALATIPIILLYLMAQRQFIEGLTGGAVKG